MHEFTAPHRRLFLTCALAIGLLGLAGTWLPPTAQGVTIFGIEDLSTDSIVNFESTSPGTFKTRAPIQGLAAGETIVGLDKRPADGALYVLTIESGTSLGRLRTIDPATGVLGSGLALVQDPADMSTPYLNLGTASGYDIDFHPLGTGFLRVVSTDNFNLRVHPTTGHTTTDSPLHWGGANIGQPSDVVASAYTNSFSGAMITSLFGYEFTMNELFNQATPNDGVLTPVGSSGITVAPPHESVSLDISPLDNTAYLAASAPTHKLFTVDLMTGSATEVGPTEAPLNGITVQQNVVSIQQAPIGAVEGSTAINATIERSGASADPTEVMWTLTPGGSGASSGDVDATSGSVTFGAGQTLAMIAIPVANDSVQELPEAFTLTIAANALQVPNGRATVTPHRSVTVLVADDDLSLSGPAPTPAPADTASPVLLAVPPAALPLTTFLKRGVRVEFSASEAVTGTGLVQVGTKVIGKVAVATTGPAARTLVIRPDKTGRKVLAANQRKRLKSTIVITVQDTAGNAGTARRPLALIR